MSRSAILFSSNDKNDDPAREGELLKKFQNMLQGVPPPASVTMSKLSVSDMLCKYKENVVSFGIESSQPEASTKSYTKNPNSLVYYLNSSNISEEIANLSQKVQSRYIYSETMSSCNIWFDSVVKSNSAKKRSGRRNGFGLSPGSRLSHLARRRQIFSCENLQQLANSDKRRHIEIKKSNALKNRILERNTTIEVEKLNIPKRALFLSPDEDNKNVKLTSDSIRRNLFPSSGKSENIQNNKKIVGGSRERFIENLDELISRKRKRTESREGNGSWPRRALTFTDEDSDKNQEFNSRNAKVISEVQLSLHHRSKLLWAVSVTLKENNMSSKDPFFKTCASALFMICRKNLEKILNTKIEGGTSEKMLHFAREQIGEIFKKLGVCRKESNAQCEHNEKETNADSREVTKENTNTSAQTTEDKSEQESLTSCQLKIHPHNNEKENINLSVGSGFQ